MDLAREIREMLADPTAMSAERLTALAEQYPYLTLPSILLLKYHGENLDEGQRDRIKQHLALASNDRRALFDLAAIESADFVGLYPPEPQTTEVTTDNALDTFFANYGTEDSEETKLLERLIFNPTPEYAELLADEDQGTLAIDSADPLQSSIDAFLKAHPVQGASHPAQAAKPKASASTTPPEDSSLSESLAKFFVKQGRYERAFEIISKLSLNNPKKSVYFADQMRFLQKLIKLKQLSESIGNLQ